MLKYSPLIITIIILINIIQNSNSISESEGRTYSVFGKLKSGFQFAGKLLGIDQASGVAQLVSEAFGKTHKKGDGNQDANIFSGFLRILGFDTKKIGAIAVNAIIFFAQLFYSLMEFLCDVLSTTTEDIFKDCFSQYREIQKSTYLAISLPLKISAAVVDEMSGRNSIRPWFILPETDHYHSVSFPFLKKMLPNKIEISTSIKGTPPSQLIEARKINSGSPFDWLMNHTKVTNMLTYATDKELPKHIVNYIQEHSIDEDTACIQLLICKSAPFVWGMQRALESRNNRTNTGMNALFAYLPTKEEVADNGDKCERNHRLCIIDM